MSRQNIINTAAAENGTKENPANSNKTKYGVWYGLNAVPWCAIFVSWVFDKAGIPLGQIDTPKGYQYCPSAFNFWKARNRLTNSPQPGDIVLFDWDGDGKSDHTGIFVKWTDPGNKFQSWEGNTAVGNESDGGMVMLRTRSKTTVKAFVDPGIFNDGFQPVPATFALKQGDKGTEVTNLQKMLYDLRYTIVVDGDFGPATKRTVKEFQTKQGIAITGIVDLITFGVLEAELNKPKVPEKKTTTGAFLKKGNAGAGVVALQKALNKKGASPKVTEDGVFGTRTQNAVKAFQKKNKLTIDGVVGPQTFKALGVK